MISKFGTGQVTVADDQQAEGTISRSAVAREIFAAYDIEPRQILTERGVEEILNEGE